jgi:hypothetical protein
MAFEVPVSPSEVSEIADSSTVSFGRWRFWRSSPDPNVAELSWLWGSVNKGVDSDLSDVLDSTVEARPLPPSLNALTLTGATVGTITDEAVAFVIGVMGGLLEVAALDVAGVDTKDDLEDFIVCDWLSEEWPAKDEAVGDWRRDDEVDNWTGDAVMPLSSLVGAIEALEVGVVTFWLFKEEVSKLSLSPLFDVGGVLSFPAPTAPRKRLYNPLRPFCTISPANLLLSALEEEGGGGANSLKVVRVSELDAALWILSRAWASCSLSTGADPERDAKEPRRDPSPRESKGAWPNEVLGESWEDMVIFFYSGALNIRTSFRMYLEVDVSV